jgi:hypothetical protein
MLAVKGGGIAQVRILFGFDHNPWVNAHLRRPLERLRFHLVG